MPFIDHPGEEGLGPNRNPDHLRQILGRLDATLMIHGHTHVTPGRLVHHAHALVEQAGLGCVRFLRDEFWDQAAQTFDWRLLPP